MADSPTGVSRVFRLKTVATILNEALFRSPVRPCLSDTLLVRRTCHSPTAIGALGLFPTFCNRQVQPPLRPRDCHEIGRAFRVWLAPKGLVLNADNDDGIELKSFALVDGQDPHSSIFGETSQSTRGALIELEEFPDAIKGLRDHLVQAVAALIFGGQACQNFASE